MLRTHFLSRTNRHLSKKCYAPFMRLFHSPISLFLANHNLNGQSVWFEFSIYFFDTLQRANSKIICSASKRWGIIRYFIEKYKIQYTKLQRKREKETEMEGLHSELKKKIFPHVYKKQMWHTPSALNNT